MFEVDDFDKLTVLILLAELHTNVLSNHLHEPAFCGIIGSSANQTFITGVNELLDDVG